MAETRSLTYPLVTIAIPAYKSRFLREAMLSALDQNYDNLELVIVNDHSPDDIYAVVNSFDDPRIRYYENERNLGRESIVLNWNKCLEYAQGEFFVLLCDDDMLDKDFVTNLLALAERYPYCDVFHSRTRIFDNEINVVKGVTPEWPEWESFELFASQELTGVKHHTITEFMFRTRAIREKGGYVVFPAGYYSDTASVLRFVDCGGICSYKEPLATYRKNEECISSRSDFVCEKSRAALEFYQWIQKEYSRFISKSDLYDLLDFDLASYFMDATFIDSLKVLKMIPKSVWPLRKKSALLFKKIKKEYGA